jgi:hypothetical protein
MPVLTLADERRINAFFRLREGTLREGLAERAPAVKAGATEREVFLALREMRNSW